tara:strand:- start:169 stop:339 length:171 start_codon:yes stop_codon:yes gene_type:complete
MLPFNKDQLESIARWILEESSNPIDEIEDLLHSYMISEPENFKNLWEDIVNDVSNT